MYVAPAWIAPRFNPAPDRLKTYNSACQRTVSMLGRAALLAACLVVAGCVGGGPAAAPARTSEAPTASASAQTGAIEGLVVDTEEAPIPGADVALLDTSHRATTDAGGRFVFNDLEAGTYRVAASRLGYVSTAKALEVVAGEIASARFVLEPLAVGDEGFFELTQFDGIVQCSVSFFTPINPCGTALGPDVDSWIFTINRNYTFKEGVFELTWVPTGPGPVGGEMELEVCDDLNREYLCTLGGSTSSYYEWADGPPPQALHLTNMPKDVDTYLTGAGAAFGQAPLFQQRFTIYMTLCYVDKCGDEYSALPP